MNNNIPQHWIEVQLGDILTNLESGSRPKGGVKGILSGIPSIGAEHLNNKGTFNFDNIKFVPIRYAESMNRGRIRRNDILIVKDGATTGKVSFVNEHFPYENAVVNEHVFVCRISQLINSKYIFWYLWSKEGNERILNNFKGSAQGGINTSFATNTLIPLAPILEQNQIVNKIDDLMSRIESCHKHLLKIPTILKLSRQCIIDAAISGELTKSWRAKNFNLSQTKNLWQETNLGNIISEIKAGKSIKCEERPPKKDEIGIIKVSAVSWSIFSEDESKTITDKKFYNESYLIKSGDFLFCRANTTELVGACVIVDNITKTLMLSDKILKFKFKTDINPKWILYYLRSKVARKQIEENATGNQQSMKNISQEKIKNIFVLIPPIEEQNEIVRQVESLLKLFDAIKLRYNLISNQLFTLPQVIMNKAFRGELAMHDFEDELVSEIIEKIKATKIEALQYPKSNTKKKNITKNMKETHQSLEDLIRKNFGTKSFNFSELSEKSNIEYEELKEQLYKLLDYNLIMEFDKKSECMSFKLKQV